MKRSILIASLALSLALPLAAQQTGTVQFTIRFYDKAIYFSNSNIEILAEIVNNSSSTYRFKMSPDRVFDLDFSVKTLSNKPLDHAQQFTIQRNSDQPVLYREVSLEPGERLSFVETLNQFIKITDPGLYVVQAMFYPGLYLDTSSPPMSSNMLTLSVLPGTAQTQPGASIQAEVGQILQQQPISPDEVVTYTLQARQHGQWDRFFLYLDVEGLYLQDPEHARAYKLMSDQERHDALQKYKASLEAPASTEQFLLVPSQFQVLKTSYTSDQATVIVQEKFAYTDFTEVKQYTYYLERKDQIWLIYKYDVRNLGTE